MGIDNEINDVAEDTFLSHEVEAMVDFPFFSRKNLLFLNAKYGNGEKIPNCI